MMHTVYIEMEGKSMALYVDIEKKCGAFTLKVKFCADNEVFAILGASGCGKSLTLKCIAGIETPDKGLIRLDDKILFDSEKKIDLPPRKRKTGYLFQDYALFPNMTVFQNIMCGAKNKATARDFIRRFYLEEQEKLYPSQLSGGQKQRVALARMLAAEPDIIMLDEPFSALDAYLKMQLEREIMDVLEKYGKTVLFVSHDRNEVYRLTDRIAVMQHGEIADIQKKHALFDRPQTLAATLLTGCKNISRIDRQEDGSLWAKDWGVALRVCTDRAVMQETEQERKPKEHNGTEYRFAGFRAHYFEPVSAMEAYNVLECEVVREIEDTFSMVVLFKNKGCTAEGAYSTLTWELPKEAWAAMKQHAASGIFVKIPEEQLILMEK